MSSMTRYSPEQIQAILKALRDTAERQKRAMAGVNQTQPNVVVQWGRKVDCAANGCETPHSDNGDVYQWPEQLGEPDLTADIKVNGHVCQWVRRTLTYSAWEAT